MVLGQLAQLAHARPIGDWLGEFPGIGSAMAVNHQLGEEHEMSPRSDRPLAPEADGGKNPLWFAQISIHAHGRHAGCLHCITLPPSARLCLGPTSVTLYT